MTHTVEAEVEVDVATPRLIAAVRRRVRPGEVGAAWRPALDLVWAFLRRRPGLWAGGHNVFVYWHATEAGEPMDVAFGVELTGPFEPDGEVVPVMTPGGEAASILHVGPYDRMAESHAAIADWAAAHGRKLGSASWETYGDATDDPNQIEVRITYLLG